VTLKAVDLESDPSLLVALTRSVKDDHLFCSAAVFASGSLAS